jgi:thiol-disulfide isomerase/thioredoxin
MTAQKESVVTPERFAQGLSYKEWMEQIDRNQQRFVENYEGTTVDPADAAAIRGLMAKPNGPAKCLALGEAWCPDVFRGLPVMAKLAEATGMELRIFFRDKNLDIMNEFLKNGEFQSIPTFVFYTRDHRYIAHFIERPKLANEQMHLLTAVSSKLRNPDLTPEQRQQYMSDYVAFQNGPIWAGWRDATIKEIRALLEENCR